MLAIFSGGRTFLRLTLFLLLFTGLLLLAYVNQMGYIDSANTGMKLSQPTNMPEFPRKIWQSWKTPVILIEGGDKDAAKSWQVVNPTYRYELLTDDGAITYVQERYNESHPEITKIFTDLSDVILRSDLLRYLLLYAEGGVYSDLDTTVLKPVAKWLPPQNVGPARLVVGVEVDEPKDVVSFAFCQWTVMAKPGHPTFWYMIEGAIERLRKLAIKQGTSISAIKASYGEVLDTTGPVAWTNAVFQSLREQTGKNITASDVHGLTEPLLIGDILVMPVTSFGNGQGHSNSKSIEDPAALVSHHFKGSWKSSHPPGQKAEPAEEEKKET